MQIVKTDATNEWRRRLQRNPELGFRDNSPKAGGMDWISDELYNNTLAVHDVLWRYAVIRFPYEKECPVLTIGYGSIPIAIELSQWTYPVSYIAQSWQEKKQVLNDCEHQAGFLKDVYVIDYFRDIPRARVAIFTGLLSKLTTSQIYRWLDLSLRRVSVVVCAEMTHGIPYYDWREILSKRYDVMGLWYNRKEYTFLEIKRR